ncbi:MAG: ferredoxin reductase [Gemmatimonas sp.]
MIDGAWQQATIVSIEKATPTVKTLVFRPQRWRAFLPGQHLEVRLTAPDGYTAQRSYSITSSPGEPETFELEIERLRDGEVSPWFHDVAEAGDTVETRGPFTEHFVWRPEHDGNVLLVAGGSGVAPFMSMVRHRATMSNAPGMTLLYSARTWSDIIERDELQRHAENQQGLRVLFALTRETSLPSGVHGYSRRIDEAMLRELVAARSDRPRTSFVCGNNGFVGTVADGLVRIGVRPGTIRTERYGE